MTRTFERRALAGRRPRPGQPGRAASADRRAAGGARRGRAGRPDVAGPLTFGTAGLRGPMRAGPNGMNLAVVRAAAAGLIALAGRPRTGPPAGDRVRRPAGLAPVRRGDRPGGDRCRPAGAAAARATAHPGAGPRGTELDACAGVMVTASHNPPAGQRIQGLPVGRAGRARWRRGPDRAAGRRRDRGGDPGRRTAGAGTAGRTGRDARRGGAGVLSGRCGSHARPARWSRPNTGRARRRVHGDARGGRPTY